GKVCEIAGLELEPYNSRRAAYDLAKIRSKSMVERIGRTRRYRVTVQGVKKLAAYTILREHVIKPLMAGATRPRRRRSKPIHRLDQHYLNLREELSKTFQTLGLAVA